jgi:haloacetate dehalogenase
MGQPFSQFDQRTVASDRGLIAVAVGGSGSPVLLLHGYPQTGVMWRDVAGPLAQHHTVVVADLPGYGGSFRPTPAADHVPHSKRALAVDLVQVMQELGHDRFAVGGHDRGGRVGYRMALDHPDRVDALAVLDVVPTGEVWARADALLAQLYWHWSFLAQPAPLPERMILGAPDVFFDVHVKGLGLGRAAGRYPTELMDGYRRMLADPAVVQAICEDYRAGATVDRVHDDNDRTAGRRITCPVLALWSGRGALPRLYGDVLQVWRPWAANLSGTAVDATHFLAEDAPEVVAREIVSLLAAAGSGRSTSPISP